VLRVWLWWDKPAAAQPGAFKWEQSSLLILILSLQALPPPVCLPQRHCPQHVFKFMLEAQAFPTLCEADSWGPRKGSNQAPAAQAHGRRGGRDECATHLASYFHTGLTGKSSPAHLHCGQARGLRRPARSPHLTAVCDTPSGTITV
jgi:hypothetical protein